MHDMQVGGVISSGPVIGGVPAATLAFCVLIVISRVGIWITDMVVSQIFQMVTRLCLLTPH